MNRVIRVFACSPRPGGNTDVMADNFARGARASGNAAEVTRLRDYAVLPCAACRRCAEDPEGNCPLAARDDAEELFRQIGESSLVCIASPIFFYHLPAQLKALIDRSQRFWERRRLKGPSGQRSAAAPKPGMAALVAARARGDRLFEGSLLSLRCFLDLFDIRLAGECTLMGYDQAGELAGDDAACGRLYDLGLKAAALAAQDSGRR